MVFNYGALCYGPIKKLVLLSGRCWSHQRLGAGEDKEQNTGRVGNLKDFLCDNF